MAEDHSTLELVCGFSPITFPDLRPSLLENGLKMVPHVTNVKEIRRENSITIEAFCVREQSIRQAPYFIELTLDQSREVVGAFCRCHAGINGNCKHCAAVMFFVNTERCEGKTDRPSEWSAPTAHSLALYPKGKTLEDIFGYEKIPSQSFEPPPDDLLGNFKRLCLKHETTESSLYKLLTVPSIVEQPAPAPCQLHPTVKSLFGRASAAFHATQTSEQGSCSKVRTVRIQDNLEKTLSDFYMSKVNLTKDKIISICEQSMEQFKSAVWFKERSLRVSASKAHKIFRGRKPATRLQYFFEAPPADLKALKYGRDLEDSARQRYSEITTNQVHPCGLIIHQQHCFLAASPDGISVSSDGTLRVLEIKCPYRNSNAPIDVDYIVFSEECGTQKLKKSHPIFTQVQLQMFVTNITVAHLFVFSRGRLQAYHCGER